MPTPSFTLKSLTLRAFRSVVDEQTIPLPSQGMHLLLGPSGAGKTTLIEGIAFALGYSNFSAVDLQSWDWLTEEGLRDTLEVETARGTMKVTRGKSASIHMPGEAKPRTSAKAVKEGLVQALGLDPEFYLAPLTYRPQKKPGLFLDMRDGEKKAFLTKLLGLDTFEAADKQAVANISALTLEVERAKTRHQTLLQALPVEEPIEPKYQDEAVAAQKVRAAEAEYERVRGVVEETKALDVALSAAQAAKVTAEKEKWKPALHQAERAMSSVAPVDTRGQEVALAVVRAQETEHVTKHRNEVAVLEKERETAQQLRTALKAVAEKKMAAEATVLRAERDLAALEAQTCYTCGQAWNQNLNAWVAKKAERELALKTVQDADAAAAELPGFNQTLASLADRLVALRAQDPVPTSLIEEERRLVGAIASAKSEREARISEARAEYHRVVSEAERAIQAVSAMTPEEEQVRRTLGGLQNVLSGLGHQVTQAKQGVAWARSGNESARQYYEQAITARASAARKVQEAFEGVHAAEAALHQEQDFLGMVRGFLSYIFDETLARIADATNARLALIPNVSDITLRFASERETGSGKLRQEITAVCEKNGHTIPLKAGISGGMYTAVELAVDLSLADVIAERTGVYPGWLILDEAFEGLDTPCKAACFDMLKSISNDRAVFVVDHTQEFAEMFDSRISVTFDGQRSTISTGTVLQ